MGPFRPLWAQPYALTTLLTGMLAAALAVLVICRSPRSPAARWWAILCSCVAGWAFVNTLSLLCVGEADSLRYLRIADAIALFTPVTFLHFTMHFAGRLRPRVLRLAIVQQILHDHGGTIAVASTPGRGATFTVTLPSSDMRRQDAI